jgi:hypothetical protein
VPELQPTTVAAERIAGGFLLAVRASAYGYFPGSILAVVDDDGVVRWEKCLDTDVTGIFAASSGVSEGIVLTQVAQPDGSLTGEYRILDLATGAIGQTLADRLGSQAVDASAAIGSFPAARSATTLLLAPQNGTPIDLGRDRLLRIDLRTLQADALPLPGVIDTSVNAFNQYALDLDGNPFLLGTLDNKQVALSRYLNGGWTDQTSPLPAYEGSLGATDANGVTVDFPGTGQAPLSAVGADGSVLWSRDDILGFGDEGFRVAQSGDVTVVRGCLGTFDLTDGGCDKPGVVGVRSADGSTVWTLAGSRNVGPVGDGFALISEPFVQNADGSVTAGGWDMVDTSDGSLVAGQHWDDPSTFEQQCCGGADTVHVGRMGSVLVAVNQRRLTIWFPKAAKVTPHEVSLG